MKKNLFIKNNIQPKYLSSSILKKLSKEYKKIILGIKNDVKNPKETLNVLSEKLKFNFENKDFKKFKKFKTIVVVGMGGSILGAEAIYGFLRDKIENKFYFFDNLDSKKISNFKKKK